MEELSLGPLQTPRLRILFFARDLMELCSLQATSILILEHHLGLDMMEIYFLHHFLVEPIQFLFRLEMPEETARLQVHPRL